MAIRRQWLSLFSCARVCAGAASLLVYLFVPLSHAEPPEKIDPVVVEEESPDGKLDPTSPAQVVHPAVEDSLETLGEYLKSVPGIQLRGESGWGREIGISLRGTDNQQSLILLDNVPLNTSIGGGVDLSLLPLSSLKTVEIYRGGSALFGANAIGGTIRLLSRDPGDEPYSSAAFGAGSFGKFVLSGFHATRWGPVGIATGLGMEEFGGGFSFRDSNGVDRVRENNDLSRSSAFGRLSYQADEGARLSLTDHYHASDRGAPGVEQYPTSAARMSEIRNIVVANGDWFGLGKGDWSIEGSLWHQLRSFEYRDPEPAFPPAINNRVQENVVGGHAAVGFWKIPDLAVRARLEGRGEWAEVRRSESKQSPDRFRIGGVLSTEYQPGDGSLLLTTTLRADQISDAPTAFVWKVGFLGQPNEVVTIRLNAGRAYRPPSFEELYYDTGTIRGNSELHAEDAFSIDGSLAIRWGKMKWEVGGFWLDIENLILFLPKTAFLLEADDSHEAINQGLETLFSWDVNHWFTWTTSYTFVHTRFKETGYQLPARSPHLLQMRGDLHWKRSGIYVQADWQSGFSLDRFEQLKEEERWLVRAGVRLWVTPWLQLAVDGRNLLDKRDAVDALQFPIPGLSVFGRVTVKQ